MLSEVAADRLPVAAGRHSGWGLQGKGSGAVRQTWALGMPLPGASPSPLCPSGTLIPSAQRFVWAAKQPLGNAALGALFA